MGELDRGVEEMTIACGTKLGPYEILSAIGAGGMCEPTQQRPTTNTTLLLRCHISLDGDGDFIRRTAKVDQAHWNY
jgi:hypothetical protein